MLDIDGIYASFFAALKRPGTGICYCWRVTRLDEVEYLFTDHDEFITIAAAGGDPTGSPTLANLLTFTPIQSFGVTATKKAQGLAVDNLSIIGLIDDGGSPYTGIEEKEVLAELFADATVEIWLCAWTDKAAGLLPLKNGTLGTMTFRTTSFEAEMRGLAERLQRQVHRAFSIECDAVLGDTRCGVVLGGSPGFQRAVTVQEVTDNRTFIVDLNEADDWAQYGLAEFTSGENNGLKREIVEQIEAGGSPGVNQITLLIPMPFDVSIGDALIITVGCNKTFAACKEFDNAVNYRGFHLIPLVEVSGEFPDAKS